MCFVAQRGQPLPRKSLHPGVPHRRGIGRRPVPDHIYIHQGQVPADGGELLGEFDGVMARVVVVDPDYNLVEHLQLLR